MRGIISGLYEDLSFESMYKLTHITCKHEFRHIFRIKCYAKAETFDRSYVVVAITELTLQQRRQQPRAVVSWGPEPLRGPATSEKWIKNIDPFRYVGYCEFVVVLRINQQ